MFSSSGSDGTTVASRTCNDDSISANGPMTVLDIPALAVGDRVEHPFLVLDVDQIEGEKPRTILTLGNATGEIVSAPVWPNDRDKVAGVAKGHVVQVIGEVGDYRGKRQLQLASVRPLPEGMIDRRALFPSVPAAEAEKYWEKLDEMRATIGKPRLRALLDLFFEDAAFRGRFGECPASPKGHHARLGGLLQHVWEVAHVGRAIARALKGDADLVTAGALLHDIGKLEAYDWSSAFETTVVGTLHGHVALGLRMLERRLAEEATPPCTPAELDLIEHYILSHHGKLEFGAATVPMTLEAEILHFADDASAKSSSFVDALRDVSNFRGDDLLSDRLWQLDRRKVYRGVSDWGVEGG